MSVSHHPLSILSPLDEGSWPFWNVRFCLLPRCTSKGKGQEGSGRCGRQAGSGWNFHTRFQMAVTLQVSAKALIQGREKRIIRLAYFAWLFVVTKVLLEALHTTTCLAQCDWLGGAWTQRLIQSSVDFTASSQHRLACSFRAGRAHHQCLVFAFSVALPVRRLTVNLSSRKIPGLNVYAQMQNEKEQEMKSPANPTEASAGSQRDLVHSLEILDTEFNSRPIGEYAPASPEPRCATRLAITCRQAIACLIVTHPVPFFFLLFLRSEKVVAMEGPTRARKEQRNNALLFSCSAFTV